MHSFNLSPAFFLSEEEKIALEEKQAQKVIRSLLLPTYKTNKEPGSYNKHLLKQQKENNLIQQQEKNFHQRQLKRKSILNSQYLKYLISRKKLKRLQIENQSDKQGRNANTVRVIEICTRIIKNFRISRKNFGVKNKKNSRGSFATSMQIFTEENDVKYLLKQQEQEIKEIEKTFLKINSLESQE